MSKFFGIMEMEGTVKATIEALESRNLSPVTRICCKGPTQSLFSRQITIREKMQRIT